jgi:hypothetical protein
MINTYLSEKQHTMNKITGYQYIDQPATELLEKLPNDIQSNLMEIFTQIHSAGKAEGYSQSKYPDYHTIRELSER